MTSGFPQVDSRPLDRETTLSGALYLVNNFGSFLRGHWNVFSMIPGSKKNHICWRDVGSSRFRKKVVMPQSSNEVIPYVVLQ